MCNFKISQSPILCQNYIYALFADSPPCGRRSLRSPRSGGAGRRSLNPFGGRAPALMRGHQGKTISRYLCFTSIFTYFWRKNCGYLGQDPCILYPIFSILHTEIWSLLPYASILVLLGILLPSEHRT